MITFLQSERSAEDCVEEGLGAERPLGGSCENSDER